MPKTVQQTRRQAKRLFRWCFVSGTLDEDRARKAVQGVLQSRRRGSLTLLSQLQRLVKLDRARHTAAVESALPLSPWLQSRTRETLQGTYGPGITTTFAQDADLIAGMRIQIGCDVYDGSVRSRLALLERSLGIEPIRQRARAT